MGVRRTIVLKGVYLRRLIRYLLVALLWKEGKKPYKLLF
jgi:hypothetical protein